jgi:16S rRNA (guanine966-N2)-methyltransferase
MRIVAGSAKGRTLAAPKSDAVIRPTADRVRETIFNVLGQRCDGLSVLDLYAGTGAMGLEALSRGATNAVLVDRHREALDLCRLNSQALRFEAQVKIIEGDALSVATKLGAQGRRFHLIFADPPYRLNAGPSVLEVLTTSAVLKNDGVVVIETGRDEEIAAEVAGFTRVDQRLLGSTRVAIFRLTGSGA